MLGFENIGGQLKGFVDTSVRGSINEALSKIPGYAFISESVRRLNAREKGKQLGVSVDATVVDEGEMAEAKKKITKELGGTLNPIRTVWNLVRRIFGSSSLERANAEIATLQSYAGLYDSQMFANEAIKFSLSQLQRRIGATEGWFSKLGLRTNAKVNNDAVVKQFKETMKKWLQPFQNIIHGGVEGVGFTKNDWDFLSYIRDQIRSGTGSKYMTDILNDFENILREAHQAWMERYNADMKRQ